MSKANNELTMYSDYVCPFCFLGRRSLERYLDRREEDLEIDWRPFDLRAHKRGPDGEIDPSVEDGKDAAYFEQVRRNVDRLKDAYDAADMRPIDELRGVDSFLAQVASFYVKQEHPERWLAFDEAVFEALWVDGRDIGDIEVLVELAEAVGIPGEEIRSAVGDEALRDRLRSRFADAQERGVTGVPTFAHGQQVARGAVPPDHLQQLIEGR